MKLNDTQIRAALGEDNLAHAQLPPVPVIPITFLVLLVIFLVQLISERG